MNIATLILVATLIIFPKMGLCASYEMQISQGNTGEEMLGDPVVFAKIYGPNGITDIFPGATTEGVTLQIDNTDHNKVIVTVEDSVIGDVVLSSMYSSTAGHLVYAQPKIVASHPAGNTVTGISLDLQYEKMAVEDHRDVAIWRIYDNEARNATFLTPESDLQITSSDPTVVSVNGPLLRALAPGESTITAVYNGFTSSYKLTVEKPFSI